MRIMRAASGVIYDGNYEFEYGKAHILKESPQDKAVIVSSLRGVHEALAAAKELEKSGIKVGVVDMPSIDESFLLKIYDSGKLIVVAEQNNGYIWPELKKLLFKNRKQIDNTNLLAINTLDSEGRAQFIHSANYSQLLDQFGLTPGQIAETIKNRLNKR
jgi:transketolase C-terminal domain/subunit